MIVTSLWQEHVQLARTCTMTDKDKEKCFIIKNKHPPLAFSKYILISKRNHQTQNQEL